MKILKNQTIREYLSETGLLLEADETLAQKQQSNGYYGINVTKTDKEPIDQVQGLICLKRFQEWNLANWGIDGKQIVFIGGLFEILNAKNLEELENLVKINASKEKKKVKLIKRLAKAFDLDVQIKITADLWQDKGYWQIVYELVESQIFTRGNLINDTLNFYNSKDELMRVLKLKQIPKEYINLPLKVLKKIGNWPAPLLYTPVQVAEGLYLKQKYEINAKIGQWQERTYDKYLKGELNTYRLKQSVDLFSRRNKVQIVTPYIDKSKKKDQGRIYFGENQNSIEKKLTTVNTEDYIFTTDEKYCEVINPVIEKMLYTIESARAQDKLPVKLRGFEIYESVKLLELIANNRLSIQNLKDDLAEIICKYITKL